MKIFFASACGVLAFACAKSPDPKYPIKPAELCGLGPSAHVCPRGSVCQQLIPASSVANAEAPPRGPSSVGGSCGGVAGFRCAEGLICQMAADQQYVADGMGTCMADSQCILPRPRFH
ncbi:MAG: hypothetical protein ABI183_04210 [Polyangiaceae bacterium]